MNDVSMEELKRRMAKALGGMATSERMEDVVNKARRVRAHLEASRCELREACAESSDTDVFQLLKDTAIVVEKFETIISQGRRTIEEMKKEERSGEPKAVVEPGESPI